MSLNRSIFPTLAMLQKLTKSMAISLADLNLDHLYVVTPQGSTYPLAEKITAQGLDAFRKTP